MHRKLWMSKSKMNDRVTRRVGAGVKQRLLLFSPSPILPIIIALTTLLFASGCRRDMQDQPKMKPFRTSTFFQDGLSGRQPVEGTIARGFLRTDTAFYTGKKTKPGATAASASPQPATNGAAG